MARPKSIGTPQRTTVYMKASVTSGAAVTHHDCFIAPYNCVVEKITGSLISGAASADRTTYYTFNVHNVKGDGLVSSVVATQGNSGIAMSNHVPFVFSGAAGEAWANTYVSGSHVMTLTSYTTGNNPSGITQIMLAITYVPAAGWTKA